MVKRKLSLKYIRISMIVLIITPMSSDVIIIKDSFVKSDVTYTTEMMWNQTYGGNSSELAYALIQTHDNGFALAGRTTSYGAGESDMWLVKTDETGELQWNRTYGGPTWEAAHSLLQASDGSFVLAGYTRSYNNDTFNESMWLVKTDSNGRILWNQTFGETKYSHAEKLIQIEDGGFVVVGNTRSFDTFDYDLCLVKTDSDGVMQWNRTYGGTDRDEIRNLIHTIDEGFVLAGSTGSFGAGYSDMWLVKTDPNGELQWNHTYGGTLFDSAYDVIQTTDSGFALVGHTRSYGTGMSDIWLVRTDSNGIELWNQTYGGEYSDVAFTLVQTTDGGVALAGLTELYIVNKSDMWLVKTDGNGIEQWNRSYGGIEDDYAYALLQTAEDSFVIAGVTSSFGAGSDDMWLVKISYHHSYTLSIPYNVIFGSFLLLLIASFLVFVFLYLKQKK